MSKIIPLYTTASADKFVDPALVPLRNVVIAGKNFQTSALLFNKQFSLLGLAQSQDLIAAGDQDPTDSVGTAAIESVVFQLGEQIHLLEKRSEFGQQPSASPRQVSVEDNQEFNTKLDIDGTAVDLTFTLSYMGQINLETTTTEAYARIALTSIVFNIPTEEVPDSVHAKIGELGRSAKMLGYYLTGEAANYNHAPV